jgi:hypothetical protein
MIMAAVATLNHETRYSGLDPESSGFLLDTGLRRYDGFEMCFTLKVGAGGTANKPWTN